MRDRIIDISKKLFLQHGFRNVTIDEICRNLNISKKTFYQYFSQKEELIACHLASIREMHQKTYLKNEGNEKDVIERFLDDIKFIVKFDVASEGNMSRLKNVFYELEKYYPELYSEHNKKMGKIVTNNVSAYLKKGIEEGLFRDDLDVEFMTEFWKLQMKNLYWKLKDTGRSTSDILKFCADVFIRSVANEKGMKIYFEKINNQIWIK